MYSRSGRQFTSAPETMMTMGNWSTSRAANSFRHFCLRGIAENIWRFFFFCWLSAMPLVLYMILAGCLPLMLVRLRLCCIFGFVLRVRVCLRLINITCEGSFDSSGFVESDYGGLFARDIYWVPGFVGLRSGLLMFVQVCKKDWVHFGVQDFVVLLKATTSQPRILALALVISVVTWGPSLHETLHCGRWVSV